MSKPLMSEMVVTQAGSPDNSEWLARLEELWDEPLPDNDALLAAHALLQGAWFASGGRRDAELLISGRHFTMRFADGDIYMGVYHLNPAGEPFGMDMYVEEGPVRHRGKTALCIWTHDGAALRWCTGKPGESDRPTDFPLDEDPQLLCLTFRREEAV